MRNKKTEKNEGVFLKEICQAQVQLLSPSICGSQTTDVNLLPWRVYCPFSAHFLKCLGPMEKEWTGHIFTWCWIHLPQMVLNPPWAPGLVVCPRLANQNFVFLDSSDWFRGEHVTQLVWIRCSCIYQGNRQSLFSSRTAGKNSELSLGFQEPLLGSDFETSPWRAVPREKGRLSAGESQKQPIPE